MSSCLIKANCRVLVPYLVEALHVVGTSDEKFEIGHGVCMGRVHDYFARICTLPVSVIALFVSMLLAA